MITLKQLSNNFQTRSENQLNSTQITIYPTRDYEVSLLRRQCRRQ